MAGFITLCFEEAIQKSLALATSKQMVEWVDTTESLQRVVAQVLTCKKNLPSFNNAAMDGFGIKYEDLGKTLGIAKTIFAGDSVNACLGENQCYKIMTGAKVPEDIDTIVPFENALSHNENEVKLPTNIKKGNALRLKGEEQEIGSILITKGTLINSQVISMLASQGISKVPVYKQISIAVFSTGNELKEPWEVANEDEIYNINSSSLISLFKEHGFKADYCGVIPDSLEQSIEYFSKMKSYDVLVTSGGISMGEADFVEEALKQNGLHVEFHGINIKPGKPTMFGKMSDTIVCSMPGNPLAAYVNAYLFLLPVLKKLQGYNNYLHQQVMCKNGTEFKAKAGRTNIILGKYEDLKFNVIDDNKYGSGMITPLLKGNSILVTDEKTSVLEKDKILNVYLI